MKLMMNFLFLSLHHNKIETKTIRGFLFLLKFAFIPFFSSLDPMICDHKAGTILVLRVSVAPFIRINSFSHASVLNAITVMNTFLPNNWCIKQVNDIPDEIGKKTHIDNNNSIKWSFGLCYVESGMPITVQTDHHTHGKW